MSLSTFRSRLRKGKRLSLKRPRSLNREKICLCKYNLSRIPYPNLNAPIYSRCGWGGGDSWCGICTYTLDGQSGLTIIAPKCKKIRKNAVLPFQNLICKTNGKVKKTFWIHNLNNNYSQQKTYYAHLPILLRRWVLSPSRLAPCSRIWWGKTRKKNTFFFSKFSTLQVRFSVCKRVFFVILLLLNLFLLRGAWTYSGAWVFESRV